MLRDVFLEFNGNDYIVAQKQLFTNIKNTFTVEFWVKPEKTHEVDKESRRGIKGITGKRYAIAPVYGAYLNGDIFQAGVGVSVGTNGISVYEHTKNYFPATLVYETKLETWTHIAIVYKDKTPTLYVNGNFVKSGVCSSMKTVVPSGVFGGVDPYGFYVGGLGEVRIWNTARTSSEIQQHMNHELTGNELNLSANWRFDEGNGLISKDITSNGNNCSINGVRWKEAKRPENKNILFTFYVPSGGVETLNRQRHYALNNVGVNCEFLYSQEGTGLQNKMDAPIYITNKDLEIKEIINKGNYDAIVVGSDLLLLKKLRDFGYKGIVIYEIQGLGFNKEYAEQFLIEHAPPYLNEYCDALLYPKTPHLIEAFERNYPHKEKFSFHNCFNTTDFNYKDLQMNNQNPIIGWVGRLEENKNWQDFLVIGSELIKKNHSIMLWMFEDNTLAAESERIKFEKKIDELNIRNNLTIHANQPHKKMEEFFSMIGDSGGFLCSTSKVEGFGYAVLEAMICRCPVLSTHSDGVSSFIIQNKTGKFFELGNIQQAVEEGNELMADIPLRESIRQNGVDHIKQYFSPTTYAKNFLDMVNYLSNHS
ncbi:glycosyltransferase [Cytobacillus horneckiae]|uniref:glycosyltransferase n=1 Tax=Cytobacillus horneckiae TaxID=549687 RepID=UPI003D9A6AD6